MSQTNVSKWSLFARIVWTCGILVWLFGNKQSPQLYYVLDNLQDDVEDIENKLKRAALEDYKNVYQAALNLAKKVYDILSILLASEE